MRSWCVNIFMQVRIKLPDRVRSQAAWRFYANPNVSLEGLLAPLVEQTRREMPLDCKQYGLAIHDWSDLPYDAHTSKKDRREIGSGLGYRLATTLLISDLTGTPIAPISLANGDCRQRL
jgi:hypothetical protein